MSDMKQLLSDMKKREELRNNEIEGINEEIKRIDLRQETETARFITDIEADRQAGLYNNMTDGQFQQLIDKQKTEIEEKYNGQREEQKQKIEEVNKKCMEEKSNDYKGISSEIKDYHLEMVLKSNEEQKKLAQIEAERDKKIQEINNIIKQKEAEQTHLVMQNRNFMDVGTNAIVGEINSLGIEIERLKEEKDTIANEYLTKIEEQNKTIQYYLQQKERAGAFLGKITLSEKSIDEIYNLFFDAEPEKEVQEELKPEPKVEPVVEPELEPEPKVEQVVEAELEPEPEPEPKAEQVVESELKPEPKPEQETTQETAQESPVEEEQIEEKAKETKSEIETEIPKHEGFWKSLRKFMDEQNIIEEEETEEPVEETNIVPTPRTKAPIKKLMVYIAKDGSSMQIKRNDRFEGGDEKTRLGKKNLGDIETEIDSKLLETAKAKGDKYVIREILLNLNDKEEKEEQLRKYIDVLEGKYIEDSPFEINYYLKDIKKAGLSKDDKDELFKNAKKIRDLNKQIEQKNRNQNALGAVEVSAGREILWSLQDLGNGISSGIKKMWDRINTIRLPKGKEEPEQTVAETPIQETSEQEAPVQETPSQAAPVQKTPEVAYDKLGNRLTKTPEEIAADNVAKAQVDATEQSKTTQSQEGTSLFDDIELPF